MCVLSSGGVFQSNWEPVHSKVSTTSAHELGSTILGVVTAAMSEAIEEQGGAVKSGVSKNLNILVCKDPNSTSGKAVKARKLGVEIITPDEMWNRLGGRP